MEELRGSCGCGKSTYTLSRAPTRRFLCHCGICQAVYKAPYADAMITNASTVEIDPASPLTFRHLNGSKSIDRGICDSCGSPTMGFMKLGPGLRLGFVPTPTLSGAAGLPDPAMHIFYESRAADVEDSLPKYDTPGRSMRACLWPFVAGFAGW
ncbi:GFA family protein [Altererythrobacter sp. MF3-039]|uniref:GFA family protein n=1 Tax=Altererythrobacter sp. MF3-039 TaxID=3252901 RepID=UPI00390C5EEE